MLAQKGTEIFNMKTHRRSRTDLMWPITRKKHLQPITTSSLFLDTSFVLHWSHVRLMSVSMRCEPNPTSHVFSLTAQCERGSFARFAFPL